MNKHVVDIEVVEKAEALDFLAVELGKALALRDLAECKVKKLKEKLAALADRLALINSMLECAILEGIIIDIEELLG